jgi:iron(II)-dependent oxidoreductase
VVRVSLHEAEAFARFVGKRLPSDEEWSKAAAWDPQHGASHRQPWGDRAPDASRANLDARSFAPDPVGSRPAGRSFYGCHQMVGDAWEWTASELGALALGGEPGPLAPRAGKGLRVLRGGSWATSSRVACAELRRLEAPHRRDLFAGFRCARDA